MTPSDKAPLIITELNDLIKQATEERSHYYVKSVCQKAQLAIGRLMSDNRMRQAHPRPRKVSRAERL